MGGEGILYWGIALIAVSVLLLVIEGFVPSGGLIGVTAGACAIVGVGMLFRYGAAWGVTGLLTVAVLGPLAFLGALKIMPNTPLGRAVLGEVSEESRIAAELAERERRDRRRALVGLRGFALTDMRPVGEVEIDGVAVEALAELAWIDAGTPVEVTAADALEVRVRPLA